MKVEGSWHVAIAHLEPLAAILAGEKTVESRWARDRRPPWGRVAPGDLIWLKRSGGPVVGRCRAVWVEQFGELTPERVAALFARYPGIRASAEFQKAKAGARYATLIGIGEVERTRGEQASQIRRLVPSGRSGWYTFPAAGE